MKVTVCGKSPRSKQLHDLVVVMDREGQKVVPEKGIIAIVTWVEPIAKCKGRVMPIYLPPDYDTEEDGAYRIGEEVQVKFKYLALFRGQLVLENDFGE